MRMHANNGERVSCNSAKTPSYLGIWDCAHTKTSAPRNESKLNLSPICIFSQISTYLPFMLNSCAGKDLTDVSSFKILPTLVMRTFFE